MKARRPPQGEGTCVPLSWGLTQEAMSQGWLPTRGKNLALAYAGKLPHDRAVRYGAASDEAFFPGIEGQAQATVDQEFFVDIVQVDLHRAFADGQGLRNALIT
jgi:hypothetical protein